MSAVIIVIVTVIILGLISSVIIRRVEPEKKIEAFVIPGWESERGNYERVIE